MFHQRVILGYSWLPSKMHPYFSPFSLLAFSKPERVWTHPNNYCISENAFLPLPLQPLGIFQTTTSVNTPQQLLPNPTQGFQVEDTLTSPPSTSWLFPDQNRCEHTPTALHWSGFFRSLDAAKAHCVRKGSWFSSPKQLICSNVLIIRVMAASCALESLISSSYRANAWKRQHRQINVVLVQKQEKESAKAYKKLKPSTLLKGTHD